MEQNENVVNINEALHVTSISDLQKYSEGKLVRLSDFAEGQPFIVRMKRPSLMGLAKAGKIPNTLLNAASGMFSGGVNSLNKEEDMLGELYDVCRIVAKHSLIEPTIEQLDEAGVELTDMHLLEIFQYAQRGVDALESFR